MTRGWFDKVSTWYALGPVNLARVASYRLGIRTGIHPVLKLGHPGAGRGAPYFVARETVVMNHAVARNDWRETGLGFGHVCITCVDGPPEWHCSILSGQHARTARPWNRLGAFDAKVGDIKGIWECSRFDWLLAMAQRAAFGDSAELNRLNHWLDDWSRANPAYLGSNWMCGQEASIRVLHLALAAMLLDQIDVPQPALVELVLVHLRRIAPTMSYAIGQDNNHGTSEAAALFVGGSWVERLGIKEGAVWARTGRRRLAERAKRLIERDGSFSQYSLVYHRLMLDTYCFAECWRQRLSLAPFSALQQSRLESATRWLNQMVDPETGDGPNLGANDGARLFVLEAGDYRDFRPSLQWAAALFLNRRAIAASGPWDQRLFWTGIERPEMLIDELRSQIFEDGGYHVLRAGRATAHMRFPRFRFRPSQADAMHVDLSVDGENVLRDGGSFSYNADAQTLSYFGGVDSHNSVMFDGRDQMPRLGRFLFGRWLKRGPARISEEGPCVVADAAYQDYQGARHERRVTLSGKGMTVVDILGGNARQAVLRWRLAPGEWQWEGAVLRCGSKTIRVDRSDAGPSLSIALSSGEESRYYAAKSSLPVLEVQVALPATLITEVEF